MNRTILFAAVFCALPAAVALADTRDDVLAGIQRCQAIPDDRAWLDCTYGAQQPMRAKLGLAPAPEFQQRLVPSTVLMPAGETRMQKAAPVSHRKPSFLQILTGSAPPVAVSNLAAIQYDSQGAFSMTLQNGQVWHQLDSETNTKVRFKIGDKVTVKPGALGSYNLQADQTSGAFKVEPKR